MLCKHVSILSKRCCIIIRGIVIPKKSRLNLYVRMTLAKEGQKGDGLRAHAPLAATSQPGRKEVGLKPQHNHQNNHDFNLSPLAEGATNRAHLYQQDSRFDDRVESIINALMPLAPF